MVRSCNHHGAKELAGHRGLVVKAHVDVVPLGNWDSVVVLFATGRQLAVRSSVGLEFDNADTQKVVFC